MSVAEVRAMRLSFVVAFVGWGLVASGCSAAMEPYDGGTAGGDGVGGGSGVGGAGVGGAGGAGVGGAGVGGGGGGGGGSTASGCPAYSAGNPMHHAFGQESSTPIITADQTWQTDHIYFVLSLFEVKGCTLTINAGARVCLAPGNGVAPTISVSGMGSTEGKVLINGTAQRPVIFDRATASDTYSGFLFSGVTDARFDHVVFRNSGAGGLGTLRFAQGHLHPAVLREVHLESFYKTGLNLQNPGGLSADSTLYVDSQQATSTEPIIVTAIAAAKTLTPATTRIATSIAAGSRAIRFVDHNVDKDLTLSGTLNADYYMQTGDLVVRRADPADPIPTLTLEAGARIRFGDGQLVVGNLGAGGEGNLTANGVTAKPVVLTSASATPARGQWNGVLVYVGGLGTTTLRNVRIENAGGNTGANLVNCRSATSLNGAIKLRPIQSVAYAGPTLENLVVDKSGGDGVAFGCTPSGCLTTDYTAAVTGTDNAGPLVRPLGCN